MREAPDSVLSVYLSSPVWVLLWLLACLGDGLHPVWPGTSWFLSLGSPGRHDPNRRPQDKHLCEQVSMAHGGRKPAAPPRCPELGAGVELLGRK